MDDIFRDFYNDLNEIIEDSVVIFGHTGRSEMKNLIRDEMKKELKRLLEENPNISSFELNRALVRFYWDPKGKIDKLRVETLKKPRVSVDLQHAVVVGIEKAYYYISIFNIINFKL